jgi:phenylacetate-CoA ligase
MAESLATLGGYTCLAAPPYSPNKKAKGASIDDLLNEDFDNVVGRSVRLVLTAGAPTRGEVDVRARLDEAAALAGNPPVAVCEWYGSAEVGIAAASCDHGHLHFVQGTVYGEVVDPETGAAVGDGERGLVVLTALRNGSRYLRYVVGDAATVETGPCACGRTTPRLTAIARVEDAIRLKRGCAVAEVKA